jgi:hypothetical protein
MDMILSLTNAAVCGVLALLLTGMVLSNRVRDGVVIKAGLIAMALGFGAIALCFIDGSSLGDGQRLARALLLVNIGIGVVVVGYLWRTYRAGHSVRRITDWADLERTT